MLKIKELGSKLGLNPADWAQQDIAETELGWVPGHPIPEDPLRWGKSFKEGSEETLRNTQMRRNLGYATGKIRAKRNTRVEEMPDWEALRESASNIKRTVAANWVALLEQFEANVTAKGGVVHWARDADEANRIVYDLVKAKGVDEVVKVKSMATQEINLNEYLGKHGIQAWETDLAEMIVQLSDDMPSHVVVPAIHRNRAEVKAIFEARMEDAGELTHEPRVLAMAARAHLRKKFLSAKVAISGANIGVAETGTVGIYESEGNGRMCLTLPETLITVMGIEKLVPRFQDLEVFSQLLPRSATGERMNPYTSFWTGVTEGDGPQEFHIILMDNGRTNVLKDPVGREALKCIRCAACMNICPVYRVTGGHAYNSVYPGPIGAILTPAAAWRHGPQGSRRHAPVRLVAVRGVLRRVPGQDQHPRHPGPPAPQVHRGQPRRHARPLGHRHEGHIQDHVLRQGHGGSRQGRILRPPHGRQGPQARLPAATGRQGLDPHPRRPRPARPNLPPVVAGGGLLRIR